MRLELADVPGGRGLRQPDHYCVHAAAEVAGGIAQVPLPSGRGIQIQDRHADAAQVGDEARLGQIAGVEQPQQPAVVPGAGGPAEGIPDGPLAFGADQ